MVQLQALLQLARLEPGAIKQAGIPQPFVATDGLAAIGPSAPQIVAVHIPDELASLSRREGPERT
jgi:hypothetical protein